MEFSGGVVRGGGWWGWYCEELEGGVWGGSGEECKNQRTDVVGSERCVF